MNKYCSSLKGLPVESIWLLCRNDIHELLLASKKKHYKQYVLNFNKQYVLNFMYIVHFIFIFLIATLKVAINIIRQILVFSFTSDILLDRVIFTVGRGYDYINIVNIIGNNKNYNIVRIFSITELMKLQKVTIMNFLVSYFKMLRGLYFILISELSPNIIKLAINNGYKNIASYSYINSFFYTINKNKPNLKVYFSGARVASHMSVYNGVDTVYAFHGLMGYTNKYLLPTYKKIFVYHADEKRYLKSIKYNGKIEVYSFNKIQNRNNSVIFFLRDEDEGIKYSTISSIINFFKSFNYDVYIKPHPRTPASHEFTYWAKKNRVQILYNKNGNDAVSIMHSLKPSFAIGSISTSLSEALNIGIIPVNAWGTGDGPFSFKKRCLSWNDDKEVLERALLDESEYIDTLNNLKGG